MSTQKNKTNFQVSSKNTSADVTKDKSEKIIDWNKLIAEIKDQSKDIEEVKPLIIKEVSNLINSSRIAVQYQIMFIYDINRSINDYTADQIYNALKASDHNKDVLLIIFSNGGSIEPAYLISKCCRKYSNRFIVAIPRRAKSAATLIALGANEIHMGAMSQLGPLDPQMLSGLPTLGLRDGIKQLLSLCSDYPIAADMIAKYLDYKLELNTLGWSERVAESAKHYAQRLLDGKHLGVRQTAETVAHAFVYNYKDHGFVIDDEEAKKYLGEIIKSDTEEYVLSNNIHNFLDDVSLFIKVFRNKSFSIVGKIDNDITFRDIKTDN